MSKGYITKEEYWYLEGYLESIYHDDDLSDGVWMQMMVDHMQFLIDEGKPKDGVTPNFSRRDAHDIVMAYLEWRRDARDEEKSTTPAP